MIKFSKILLLLISSLTLFGCYTVAWQPGEALPTKDNIEQNQSSFYNVKDYGVFSDYYYSAWWTNPDYNFLRDNLTAANNTDGDNGNFILDIISIGTHFLPPLAQPLPIIPIIASPTIVKPNPTKSRNTTSLSKSPPTRKSSSNKNKLRNNNGSRNSRRGR